MTLQLITFKTQVKENTRALNYLRLYGYVAERIKLEASNIPSYREEFKSQKKLFAPKFSAT